MKILFCKITAMRYYKGVCDEDQPHNGGSFVEENGYGVEEFNFDAVTTADGKQMCFGFVETKHKNDGQSKSLRFENISGCEMLKREDLVEDVLVVWCATMVPNRSAVVGWYKNSTVYREYLELEFENRYFQPFNIVANKEDCVLLPYGTRNRFEWRVPSARKRSYGFGQSLVWYAREEEAQKYVSDLITTINEYDGENWIDKRPEQA